MLQFDGGGAIVALAIGHWTHRMLDGMMDQCRCGRIFDGGAAATVNRSVSDLG